MIVKNVDMNYNNLDGNSYSYYPLEIHICLGLSLDEMKAIGTSSPGEIMQDVIKIYFKSIGFDRDVSINEILKKAYPQDFI